MTNTTSARKSGRLSVRPTFCLVAGDEALLKRCYRDILHEVLMPIYALLNFARIFNDKLSLFDVEQDGVSDIPLIHCIGQLSAAKQSVSG